MGQDHGSSAGAERHSSGHGGAIAALDFDPRTIERPDPKLWTYYIIVAFLTLPAVIVVLPVLYFRYHTLRYRFDDDGISMSVGILFRREVYLTYRRIQDIHVTRGIIQRWLGLATISLQTASGSSSAEMQIEGVLQADELRDWLYGKMRGARGGEPSVRTDAAPSGAVSTAGDSATSGGADDEALALLREIRDQIRNLRTRVGGGS